MKDGRKYTLHQAICLISNKEGQQLFTGVERMDRTNTSLITLHKKNLKEGTQTLQVLPKVLQGLLSLECFETLGLGNPPQSEPELIAMQKQENKYLDRLLNLKYCTEIDITKKRKKDDETVGANTAVQGWNRRVKDSVKP